MYKLHVTFNTTGCTKPWPITYTDYSVAIQAARDIADRRQVYRVTVCDWRHRKYFEIQNYRIMHDNF